MQKLATAWNVYRLYVTRVIKDHFAVHPCATPASARRLLRFGLSSRRGGRRVLECHLQRGESVSIVSER